LDLPTSKTAIENRRHFFEKLATALYSARAMVSPGRPMVSLPLMAPHSAQVARLALFSWSVEP
jgi:hypothetical protein